MVCINFKTAVVVFLALAVAAHASDCGDGSDGSVLHCCDANQGSCTNCGVGYGLSKDKTQCLACVAPNCANCDGNVAVCKQAINNKPIPNCNYGDYSIQQCFDCEDGYVISANGKACVSCPANCNTYGGCNPSKPSICTMCAQGYGGNNSSKCTKCKSVAPNCQNCGSDLASCAKCVSGYGLTNGKCQKCSSSLVQSCDNGKIVCRDGGVGTFGANGGCKNCADRLCATCDKSACDQCYSGYTYSGGKCVKSS